MAGGGPGGGREAVLVRRNHVLRQPERAHAICNNKPLCGTQERVFFSKYLHVRPKDSRGTPKGKVISQNQKEQARISIWVQGLYYLAGTVGFAARFHCFCNARAAGIRGRKAIPAAL